MATKAPTGPTALLASRTLKTVGIIMVLATLLDLIILPMPYLLGDRPWQINFVSQTVDRGIVPLVGIVLFLTGFWIDGSTGEDRPRRSMVADPRFWACILASIMGLFYLLVFPFHLNNVRLTNDDALKTLNQQATQAESQGIDARLQQEVESTRQQLTLLVGANETDLQKLVTDGRLTQEQLEIVKKAKADPKFLDTFLQQRQAEAREKMQTQIGKEKTEKTKQIQGDALKSGLRVSISSLLLAIGFIVIGWTGLRGLL
jgi:hypothetical protein